MRLDQKKRQQEERSAERAVEKQREQVYAAEAARTKQSERNHRRTAAPFFQHQPQQQQRTCRQRPDNSHILPAEPGSGDQPVYQTAQAAERQHGAAPIEAGVRSGIAAFRQTAHGNPQRWNSDQRINQKYRAPGQMIDQPAPEQRAGAGGERRRARPDPNRRTAFLLVKRSADDRQRAGNEQRRPHALDGARPDQRRDVRRETTGDRSQRAGDNADQKEPAAPEPVGGPAANQQQRGHAQRVGVDDPLHRRKRGTEIGLDRRQRDVDHGFVDERHGPSQHRRGQHPGLVTLGAGGRTAGGPNEFRRARLRLPSDHVLPLYSAVSGGAIVHRPAAPLPRDFFSTALRLKIAPAVRGRPRRQDHRTGETREGSNVHDDPWRDRVAVLVRMLGHVRAADGCQPGGGTLRFPPQRRGPRRRLRRLP